MKTSPDWGFAEKTLNQSRQLIWGIQLFDIALQKRALKLFPGGHMLPDL